jgi:hypothetical protein
MLCRRPAAQVATLKGCGWRDGPRRVDGDARNSTRTNSRAAPATLRLHLDASIPRQAPDRYVAKNAFASRPRQQDIVAWPLLKNPALTSSINTGPSLAGCLLQAPTRTALTDLHRRQDGDVSLRPSWGRPLLQLPRVLRRPRSLKGSPTRVTSSRNALTAHTKRYGLTSRSTGLKTQMSEACLHRSQLNGQGWPASCTTRLICKPVESTSQ